MPNLCAPNCSCTEKIFFYSKKNLVFALAPHWVRSFCRRVGISLASSSRTCTFPKLGLRSTRTSCPPRSGRGDTLPACPSSPAEGTCACSYIFYKPTPCIAGTPCAGEDDDDEEEDEERKKKSTVACVRYPSVFLRGGSTNLAFEERCPYGLLADRALARCLKTPHLISACVVWCRTRFAIHLHKDA